MEAQAKAKWVTALRSGQYQQHRGGLRTDSGEVCAFGVLLDQCGQGRWMGSRSGGYYYTRDGVNGLPLPYFMEEELGVDYAGAEVAALIEMNDKGLESFEEIAAYIEANL
jgi:hypothetical protein